MKDKRYKDPRLKVDKFSISLPHCQSMEIDRKRGRVAKSTYIRLMLEHCGVVTRLGDVAGTNVGDTTKGDYYGRT